MPTNHTEHYNLSQWLPEDKVLRTDFNEDNQKIDAALSELAGSLEGKADDSDLTELNKLVQRRNCGAQALYYTGDGSTTKTLTFNGRPLIVHIMGMNHHLCAIKDSPKADSVYVPNGSGQLVKADWNVRVLTLTATNTDPSSICNYKGEQYYVMAIIDANL